MERPVSPVWEAGGPTSFSRSAWECRLRRLASRRKARLVSWSRKSRIEFRLDPCRSMPGKPAFALSPLPLIRQLPPLTTTRIRDEKCYASGASRHQPSVRPHPGNAERPGRHSHAGAWERVGKTAITSLRERAYVNRTVVLSEDSRKMRQTPHPPFGHPLPATAGRGRGMGKTPCMVEDPKGLRWKSRVFRTITQSRTRFSNTVAHPPFGHPLPAAAGRGRNFAACAIQL